MVLWVCVFFLYLFSIGGVKKITAYENEDNADEPWIRSIKKISPGNMETNVNCLTYATGKLDHEKRMAGINSTRQER